MIDAKMVLHSVSPKGRPIVSWLCVYPRFIHAELMTHRMFSRNAASSRAISIHKMIDSVVTNPALPEEWGSNQKGMQAGPSLDSGLIEACKRVIFDGRDYMVERVKELENLGLHKQVSNRYIEPWMHMMTLVTATEWENFFALRADVNAQPEFRILAYKMLEAYNASSPQLLQPGEWHMPFTDNVDFERLGEATSEYYRLDNPTEIVDPVKWLLKIATARAARTSYTTIEGKDSYPDDFKLHDDLSVKCHWSPFEHSAQCMSDMEYVSYTRTEPLAVGDTLTDRQYEELYKGHALSEPRGYGGLPMYIEYGWCGNFRGWKQYRKQFKDENRTDSRVKRFTL